MIELRWLKKGDEKVLQWRKFNEIAHDYGYVECWLPWMDIPMVEENKEW